MLFIEFQKDVLAESASFPITVNCNIIALLLTNHLGISLYSSVEEVKVLCTFSQSCQKPVLLKTEKSALACR